MVKLLRYAELASGVDSDSGYFGLRPTRLRPRLRPKVGVENDAFSFENASFRYVFASRPNCNDRKGRPSFSETETFENASESGDI